MSLLAPTHWLKKYSLKIKFIPMVSVILTIFNRALRNWQIYSPSFWLNYYLSECRGTLSSSAVSVAPTLGPGGGAHTVHRSKTRGYCSCPPPYSQCAATHWKKPQRGPRLDRVILHGIFFTLESLRRDHFLIETIY